MPGHLFAPAPGRPSDDHGKGDRPALADGGARAGRRAAATAAGFALALALAPLIPLVAAAPLGPATPGAVPPAATLPFGYIVSPSAGRPGEVVRIELLTNLRQATGRILTTTLPTIRFWWSREPSIQTVGRIDDHGNVLAELVVPFSAGRGLDPIIVGVDVPPTPTPTPADTTPPVIKSTDTNAGQLCLPPGTPDRVTFFASVFDDVEVAQVTVFYRRPGDSSFQSLPMTQVDSGSYRATLVVDESDEWFPTKLTDRLVYFITATDTSGNSSQTPQRVASQIVDCATPAPSGPIIFLPLPPLFFATPTPPVINVAPGAGELGAAFGLDPRGARPVDPAADALPIRILGELPFVVTKSAGPPNWQH